MPDTFTPEQISQILEEFFKVVGTRQYIGARYVPIFGRKDEDTIEWDNTEPYEPLTIVLYQGNSYTSRQFVPVGVEITNEEFWAITGNYNAQIEMYRRETAAAREVADNALLAANAAQTDIDTLLPKADFSDENTVKDYVDDSVAVVQTDIDTLLPKADFSAENTVKDYVDSSVATVQNDIDTLLPKADFSSANTVKDYIDTTAAGIVASIPNDSYMIAFLAGTPTVSDFSPSLGISQNGKDFTPIIDLSDTGFAADVKITKIGDTYILVENRASEFYDFHYGVTRDFDTIAEFDATLGLTDYRNNTYPAVLGNQQYANRRWTPNIIEVDNKLYATVSMAITAEGYVDFINRGSRPYMRVFAVEVELANNSLSAVGAPFELAVYNNNTRIDTYFDIDIIKYNGQYVMAYKNGYYNYVSIATASSIDGVYTTTHENIFNMPGTEAPYITKINGSYVIYGQIYGAYSSLYANIAVSTNDFNTFVPVGRCWHATEMQFIRNLSPIVVNKKDIEKFYNDDILAFSIDKNSFEDSNYTNADVINALCTSGVGFSMLRDSGYEINENTTLSFTSNMWGDNFVVRTLASESVINSKQISIMGSNTQPIFIVPAFAIYNVFKCGGSYRVSAPAANGNTYTMTITDTGETINANMQINIASNNIVSAVLEIPASTPANTRFVIPCNFNISGYRTLGVASHGEIFPIQTGNSSGVHYVSILSQNSLACFVHFNICRS